MTSAITTTITCEILPATAPIEEIEAFLKNSSKPYNFELHTLAHDSTSPILGVMYPVGASSYSSGRSFIRKDEYFVRIAGAAEARPYSLQSLKRLKIEL